MTFQSTLPLPFLMKTIRFYKHVLMLEAPNTVVGSAPKGFLRAILLQAKQSPPALSSDGPPIHNPTVLVLELPNESLDFLMSNLLWICLIQLFNFQTIHHLGRDTWLHRETRKDMYIVDLNCTSFYTLDYPQCPGHQLTYQTFWAASWAQA